VHLASLPATTASAPPAGRVWVLLKFYKLCNDGDTFELLPGVP
jgi:hypothetical protein